MVSTGRIAVRAEGVTRTFRVGDEDVRALDGVSLAIGAGELVVVAGPSGSGKSTLLHLLGTLDEPLPRAYWAPLYLAVEQSLVSRSGLLGFSHDFLREAVRRRYVPDQQAERTARLGLADYFDMDATLVRVLWLIVVLCGGTGILLYVILWIVLPLAPVPVAIAPQTPVVSQPSN